MCGCNKNQPIEIYCDTHQEIICGACRTFSHHECNTSSIQEKSSSYKSSKLNSILTEVKSLQVRYQRIKKESCGKKDVSQLKEACKKEIKQFRKELDTTLETLEKNMLAKLDTWEQGEDCRIGQHVSAIAAALIVLQTDCKLLEG